MALDRSLGPAEGENVGTNLQVRPGEVRQRKRPRLKDFSYVGKHTYHLVLVTKDRNACFEVSSAAQTCCATLEVIAAERSFDLLAYCLMPDHLHTLVRGQDWSSDLSEFVRRLKQQTAFDYKRQHGGVLWQQSFFDRVLRKDESLDDVAAYIFANPLVAGLVNDASEFAYAGGSMLTRSLGSDGAKAASLRFAAGRQARYSHFWRGPNHDEPA